MDKQKNTFPLWAFLILYEKALFSSTYNNYFQNTKNLIEFLGVDTRISNYQIKEIPKLYRSYHIQELAKLLNLDQSILLQYYNDLLIDLNRNL